MLTGSNAFEVKQTDLRLSALITYYGDLADQISSKKSRMYEACLKMIERGYWSPGDRLPPETVLNNELPVGLATIQSVFRQLVADGLVIRQRKRGSFIADPAKSKRYMIYSRFIADDGKSYLPVKDQTLRVEEIQESGSWSDFLGPAECYTRVHRVTDIGGEFLILSEIYLADPRYRVLSRIPPSELKGINIPVYLLDRFGTPAVHSDRLVSFKTLSEEEAADLKVGINTAAIRYQICEYTIRSTPLLFEQIIIPVNTRTLKIAEGVSF